MKQRGIASFFGAGKAEGIPRAAKVASSTPNKDAKAAAPQEGADVLKVVNSSGTKRAREVITPENPSSPAATHVDLQLKAVCDHSAFEICLFAE